MNKVTRKQRDVVIYFLYDPRDENQTPRYVGKSEVSLSNRLSTHISESKHPARQHWYKSRWFRKLESEGVKPSIKAIETVAPGESWQDRERYWIKTYRDMGYPLTNLTDGGEGTLNKVITDQTRQNIRNGQKRYYDKNGYPKKDIPDDVIADMGKLPDRILAKRAGVSIPTILYRRKDLGIPAYKPTKENRKEWLIDRYPKEQLDLLGKLPDAEVAENMGLHISTVAKIRKTLGIPICPSENTKRIEIPKEAYDLMGKMSDKDIGDKFGFPIYIIRLRRNEKGIPAKSRDVFDTVPKDCIDKLGTMPDYLLGKEYGYNGSTIGRMRKKLGIKSFPSPFNRFKDVS